MSKGGLLIPKGDKEEIVESVLDRLETDGFVKKSVDRGKAFIAIPCEGVQVSDLFDEFNTRFSQTPTGIA